jgi:hypothetical protein
MESRPFPGSQSVAALQPARAYGHAMPQTEPSRKSLPDASTVEPSSWWPFVAIVLGMIGVLGTLVVHLLLDATHAGPWGLAWMAIPSAFIAASVGALFIASGMSVGERLTVIPAALLGYSPRVRSRQRSSEPA